MKRRIVLAAAAAAATLALAGCGKDTGQAAGAGGARYKEIRLGTISGPHAEVAEVAVKVAAGRGLPVKLVEFSDYGHVNEALSTKDLDCNAFQHVPFLNKAIESKGYKFTPLGKTVIFPIGVYSHKIRSKDEIAEGMLVTVPADPANLGRGLQLLERNGVIRLREGAGVHATTRDIVGNPKKLVFREVDNAYLGRSLPDVGFSVINGSWAVKSKLVPDKDAFILEGADSDYANVLVVRTEDKERPEFKVLLASFQSDEVRQFVKNKYHGSIVPAF